MNKAKIETVSFAAGCFWGVEEAFRQMPGIIKTVVGYQGGNNADPTYQQVSSGQTGHAETVQIKYDPDKISFQELLNKFWQLHDPTSINRQGPDVGSQYRSAIFYYSDEQKKIAEQSKNDLTKSGHYSSAIVTEIKEASPFYWAEEYHQQYYQKKGINSCGV